MHCLKNFLDQIEYSKRVLTLKQFQRFEKIHTYLWNYMSVNQDDEITTESVINIPKQILEDSDDDRSTKNSSEHCAEEMGAYYSSGPYPVDL